jgi:hypothetical protein
MMKNAALVPSCRAGWSAHAAALSEALPCASPEQRADGGQRLCLADRGIKLQPYLPAKPSALSVCAMLAKLISPVPGSWRVGTSAMCTLS